MKCPTVQLATILKASAAPNPSEAYVRRHEADNWTIERWKTEPRLVGLKFSDTVVEAAPPLWKDLTFGFVIAAILCAVATIILR